MIKIDFTTKPKPIVPEYRLDYWGNKCTYDKKHLLHSYDDLPAVVSPDGTKVWYKHGKRHRDNGFPAAIFPNGSKYWWKNGIHIRSERP